MTKESVTTAINDLPSEFTMDELFEKLDFIERVEAARNEAKQGKTLTSEEVKDKIAEWRG